jgi:phosphoribosylpyrophosphate synthetase
MILQVFKSKYPHIEIIPFGFVKRLGKDVTLKHDLINKLNDKTKNAVLSNLSKTLAADDWKMKGIYQPNKKFLDRVMWSTDQLKVQGKRVLAIDDVITEGTTLKDMIRICNENGAKLSVGYIFMSEK